MKTIKENINSKEFKKLMIYTRGREDLRRNTDGVIQSSTYYWTSESVPTSTRARQIGVWNSATISVGGTWHRAEGDAVRCIKP